MGPGSTSVVRLQSVKHCSDDAAGWVQRENLAWPWRSQCNSEGGSTTRCSRRKVLSSSSSLLSCMVCAPPPLFFCMLQVSSCRFLFSSLADDQAIVRCACRNPLLEIPNWREQRNDNCVRRVFQVCTYALVYVPEIRGRIELLFRINFDHCSRKSLLQV